jgi:deoxyribonuclease IV
MKIRFGPAGIPLSCKGRTLKDGIEDIHALELNAMEVQLVRAVGECMENLDEIKELANELDVQLSVHTPYYMDLAGDAEMMQKSVDNIKWSSEIANKMGAKFVNTHVGIKHLKDDKKTLDLVIKNVRQLRDHFQKQKLKCKLGLETSGRQQVFGSLDEILTVCKRVSGVVPVLNFAHIHAYGGGCLKKPEDFQEVFDKAAKVIGKKVFYTHFSGVEHEEGNKKRCTPIKKGDMRFEPLAECILENPNYEITVISGSPLLEHDAMYMKVILDRVNAKREAKSTKDDTDEKE